MVALPVDHRAALVEAAIKVALFGLGDVTAVPRHVPVQRGLFPAKFRVVTTGLSPVDLMVRNAAVDSHLLTVDATLDFVDPGVTGVDHWRLRKHRTRRAQ